MMRVIDLRGSDWKSVVDFYDAIGRAQYEYDGRAVANVRNINGLLELLVWNVPGQGNPPYAIRVSGLTHLPNKIRDEVSLVQQLLVKARKESISRRGFDVEVHFEIAR
jgi:hypothetical protein